MQSVGTNTAACANVSLSEAIATWQFSAGACAFIEATFGPDVIDQQHSTGLCFPGVSQSPAPFASRLRIYELRVRRAEDNDSERLRLHQWCVRLEAERRPSVLQCAVEPPPATD